MALYIMVTILTSAALFPVLFCFMRGRIPVSWKIICIVLALSTSLSIVFPYLLVYLQLKSIVLIYLCIIGAAALAVTAIDSNELAVLPPKRAAERRTGTINDMDTISPGTRPGTTNAKRNDSSGIMDLISRGFDAKVKKEYTAAAEYFKKALQLNPEPKLAALIAADISGIYRNLGRYEEALQVLRSTLHDKKQSLDEALVQILNRDLNYLSALHSLLKKTGQAHVPYAQVSSDLKRQAEEIIKKSGKE